jgi:hypothetical protein
MSTAPPAVKQRRKQGNLAPRPYQCVNNPFINLSIVAAKAPIVAFHATQIFYHFLSAIVNRAHSPLRSLRSLRLNNFTLVRIIPLEHNQKRFPAHTTWLRLMDRASDRH